MRAGEDRVETVQGRIETPYECFLPVTYIEDADERMMIYKRLAGTGKYEAIDAIEEELIDRFGPLPEPARYLMDLTRVKFLASGLGVVLVQIRAAGHRSATPEALRQAAEVPRDPSTAPRSVPELGMPRTVSSASPTGWGRAVEPRSWSLPREKRSHRSNVDDLWKLLGHVCCSSQGRPLA